MRVCVFVDGMRAAMTLASKCTNLTLYGTGILGNETSFVEKIVVAVSTFINSWSPHILPR